MGDIIDYLQNGVLLVPRRRLQPTPKGDRTPSVEVARKIANTLGVSLDYLVGNTDLKLDTDVVDKIHQIQQLPSEDKLHLFYIVDNILQNVKAKQAFAK